MIEQVTNLDFVLDQAKRAALEFRLPFESRRGEPDKLESIPEEDRAVALQELEDAITREEANLESSVYHGFEKDGVIPLKDVSFFSSDPIISLAQSAIEEYFHQEEEEMPEGRRLASLEEVEVADDRRSVDSPAPSDVADRRIAGNPEVRYYDDHGNPRRVFDKFGQTDPRWIASLIAMGIAKFRNPVGFPGPAAPVELKDKARLVMVGDWGSGIPRARKVAEVMKGWAADGVAQGYDTHVVHLGDVYYSGWEREYRNRFLKYWPVRPGEEGDIGSWCLNGNHDMYSGGHAYFKYLLADARFARQGHSSWFSFRHKHWDILGLDTAYDDHGLHGPQAGWIHDTFKEGKAAGRKGMLLSHHQLFSVSESGGPGIKRMLDEFGILDKKLIDAWFCGHQHQCVIYDPHMGVKQKRCIGHGGVPVYQWKNQADPVKPPANFEFRGSFKNASWHPETWALFGFAVLDLHPDGTTKVWYVDENGVKFRTEHLQ